MTDTKQHCPAAPRLWILTVSLGTKRQTDKLGHSSHAKKWGPLQRFSKHYATQQIIQAHTRWLWPLTHLDTDKGVWLSKICGSGDAAELVRSPRFSRFRSCWKRRRCFSVIAKRQKDQVAS